MERRLYPVLKHFAKKKGRELHGIDREARERLWTHIKSRGRIKLKKGDFVKKLKKYDNKSVKVFKADFLLLGYRKYSENLIKLVHQKLVSNGRFYITDINSSIQKIKPKLKENGFSVYVKEMKEEELKSFWGKIIQDIYRKHKAKGAKPLVLIARKKKKSR